MDLTIVIGIIIGVIIIIGAIVLVFIGLRDSSDRVDPLQDRLAEFASRGETATLEEIELIEEYDTTEDPSYLEKLKNEARRQFRQYKVQEYSR